jgi:hypothetical protein
MKGAAVAIETMGDDLPQVELGEEYSAFQHSSTARTSVSKAAGSVLRPVDRE